MKNKAIINTFILMTIVLSVGCNKPPYLPDNPPTYLELGSGDATYGADNDTQPLLPSLKVITYNIHAAVPPSEPAKTNIEAIANAIAKTDPDIVFLQEVDNATNRNGYKGNQALEIAKILKMNFYFYAARSYMQGFYGVAVLSKYPLKAVKKYNLTKESEATEQRVLGTAIVDLPGVDSVIIAVTHLQHNSATNRLQQVRDIANFAAKEKVPIILGGDFNEKPDAKDFFTVFDGAFTRTCQNACPLTFNTQTPSAEIDFLAYKPATAFSVISHNVVNETYASDHFPVVAELRINR